MKRKFIFPLILAGLSLIISSCGEEGEEISSSNSNSGDTSSQSQNYSSDSSGYSSYGDNSNGHSSSSSDNYDDDSSFSSDEGHIHNWDEATYEWDEDYSSCYAERVCFDGHILHWEEEDADSTYEVITAATESSEGLGRFTATFKNPAFETQIHDVTIDKLPFTFVGKTFVGYDIEETDYEYYDAAVTMVESISISFSENYLHITIGKRKVDDMTYDSNEVYDLQYYNDDKEFSSFICGESIFGTYNEGEISISNFPIDLPNPENRVTILLKSHEHEYGDPYYLWNEYNTECFGFRDCLLDENHRDIARAEINYEEMSKPTPETKGVAEITATFADHNYETQIKEAAIDYYSEDKLSFTLTSHFYSDGNYCYTVAKADSSVSGDVIIPAYYNGLPVKIIGDAAFSGCRNITSIVIPEGIERIGNQAFEYCRLLTRIDIPSTVNDISTERAFVGCTSLAAINVSEDNENYISVDGVLFDKNQETLIYYPFAKEGDSYTIPNTVKTIAAYSFYDKKLKVVDFEEGSVVETIKRDALTSIKAIYLPKTIKSIYDYALGNDVDLFVMYEGSEEELANVFTNIYSFQTPYKAYVNEKVGQLKYVENGDISYFECDGNAYQLKAINSDITSFDYRTDINDLNLINLSYAAFEHCQKFERIELPSTLLSLGKGFVFYDCSDNLVINYHGTIENWITLKNKSANNLRGKIHLFCEDDDSETTDVVIPDTITEISPYAFYNCVGIKSVIYNSGTIATHAFDGATGLDDVYLGSGVTAVGAYAFNNNSSNLVLRSVAPEGDDPYADYDDNWYVNDNFPALTYYYGNYTDAYGSVNSDGTHNYKFTAKYYVTIGPKNDTNAYLYSITNVSNNFSEDFVIGTCWKTITTNMSEGYSVAGIAPNLYVDGSIKNIKSLTINSKVKYIPDGCLKSFSGLNKLTINNSNNYRFAELFASEDLGNAYYQAGNYYLPKTLYSYTSNATTFTDNAFTGALYLKVLTLNNANKSITAESNTFKDTDIEVLNFEATSSNCNLYNISSGSSSVYGIAKNAVCINDDGEEFDYVVDDDNKYLLKIVAIDEDNNEAKIASYIESGYDYVSVELYAKVDGAYIPLVGIDSYAFANNVELKTIYLRNDYKSSLLSEIGTYAFENCTSLVNLYLPTEGSSLTSIGEYAFYGCTYLSKVELPNSVSSIGNYAFHDCYSLAQVTLGSGLSSIGTYAFENCYNLVEVINLSSLSVGHYVNNGYAGLYTLQVITDPADSKLSFRSDGLIAYNNNILVTYIGDDVDVVIPEAFTEIKKYAFYCHDKIEHITIPDSITSLPAYVFQGCSSLKEIVVPNSVASIGDEAFAFCTSLESLTLSIKTLPYCKTSMIRDNPLKNVYLVVEEVTDILNNGTNVYRLFSYYTGSAGLKIHLIDKDGNEITEVVIPDTVSEIPNYSFAYLSSLSSVTIPDSVTSIGDYAFQYCGSLESVNIPDSVTSLGKYAFAYCSCLTSVTIPDSVTSMGYGTFEGCSELTTIYYEGTSSEWNSVSKGSNWKPSNATVICSDSE